MARLTIYHRSPIIYRYVIRGVPGDESTNVGQYLVVRFVRATDKDTERAAALLPRVRRYASECSSLIKSFRFRFDGVVLCDEQTAADVGLESGDQIDCSLVYWNGEEA